MKDFWNQHKFTILVAVLFLIVFAIRADIAFSNDLPDYSAYNVLRQVDSIRHSGLPLFDDPLGFGGRERLFSPVFYYIMAFFSFFLNDIALIKIIPNLFAASIVFPSYHLTRFITSNKHFAFLTAGVAGLVPAAFLIGINDASSATLSLPLMFTATYLFLKSRKTGRHLNWLIAILAIMPFIDTLCSVLLISFVIYLLLLRAENIKLKGKDIEVTLFFTFFMGWISLILFKDALLQHGTSIIWQNIPANQISEQFKNFTLLEAITSTGLIPLIAGSMGLYTAISRTKKKSPILLVSIITASAILLWFRLLPITTGLYVFAVTLAIAGGYGLHEWYKYLRKTKAYRLAPYAIALSLALFLFLSIASWNYEGDTPQDSDIVVMSWAKENLNDATIMAPGKVGFFIEYSSEQQTVIDEDYLLVSRVDERYQDTLEIYERFFTTDAIGIMEKYGATHLYINRASKNLTGVKTPTFIEDDCFDIIAEQGQARLVELTCTIRGAS